LEVAGLEVSSVFGDEIEADSVPGSIFPVSPDQEGHEGVACLEGLD